VNSGRVARQIRRGRTRPYERNRSGTGGRIYGQNRSASECEQTGPAKEIAIAVKAPRASAKEFAEAWANALAGRRIRPIERRYFEGLSTLLRVLTQQRLAALPTLRRKKPKSVRKLARDGTQLQERL